MKPKVFIGSSVEGLRIAKAVQAELDHEAEVTIWHQAVFILSNNTLEDLIMQTKENEFAIFVFTPDDEIVLREQTKNTARDNVLFELGLFIGALGRQKVYFLKPRGIDMHIPTDLIGITPGSYDPNRNDGNIQAAVGPFCTQVVSQIQKIGPINTFNQLMVLMEKINPFINANIKLGHQHLQINLSPQRLHDLINIERSKYFKDFLSYVANGNNISDNSNQIGDSINDITNGPQNGYNFKFSDKYKAELK
jgi:hypothetical protein